LKNDDSGERKILDMSTLVYQLGKIILNYAIPFFGKVKIE